jgi:signal transduction histidine kinase
VDQGGFSDIAEEVPGAGAPEPGHRGLEYPLRKRALFRLLARAEENERHRIARELHDTTAQDLVAIGLNLRRLERGCIEESSRTLLDETCALLKQTQRDLRTMSYVLHPPAVEPTGLRVALETMVRGLTGRARFETRVECNVEARLDSDVEETLYRVAQEALINVCRHASACSVTIRCNRIGDRVELEVEDDGVGFDSGGEAPLLGVGLRAIRARVRAIGGSFALVPRSVGTLVSVVLPLRPIDVSPAA